MKIAILGIESSHAWGFASKLAGKDEARMFPDTELIGAYGDSTIEGAERGVEEMKKRSECEYFAERSDAFVDSADAVMITARHGGLRLEYARPYLEKGMPVLLDKPITASIPDMEEIVRLAKEHHAPICGGSCLVFSKEIRMLRNYVKENRDAIRGGHVTAPIHMVNPYGNFWFYAPHLVQMMTEIFGIEVRSVKATRMEEGVAAIYKYDDFCVTAHFGTGYTAGVYNEKGIMDWHKVTLDGCADAELEEFYHMVKTGQGIEDYRAFAAPVYIIDATIKAYEQGTEESIVIPEL